MFCESKTCFLNISDRFFTIFTNWEAGGEAALAAYFRVNCWIPGGKASLLRIDTEFVPGARKARRDNATPSGLGENAQGSSTEELP